MCIIIIVSGADNSASATPSLRRPTMTIQHTITLTVGHNVAGVPTWDMDTVVAVATTYLGCKGATAIYADGMWCGERERSTRLEIVRDNLTADDIRARVRRMSRALQQECIMCEIVRTSVEFLG
jgi:hypothetical protein